MNVVCVRGIEVKLADVGSFDCLRGPSKRYVIGTRRDFDKLHQIGRLVAGSTNLHQRPGIEFD